MAADDTPELWSTKDIAKRMGVSGETVRVLSHRDDWPKPAGRVGHIRMWHQADVETWIREHRPDKAR